MIADVLAWVQLKSLQGKAAPMIFIDQNRSAGERRRRVGKGRARRSTRSHGSPERSGASEPPGDCIIAADFDFKDREDVIPCPVGLLRRDG